MDEIHVLQLVAFFSHHNQIDTGWYVEEGEAAATNECGLDICRINRGDKSFNRQQGKKAAALVVYFSGSLGKETIRYHDFYMICLVTGTHFY